MCEKKLTVTFEAEVLALEAAGRHLYRCDLWNGID